MKSYHIFYFPFKWLNQKTSESVLAEQTDLTAIPVNPHANWLRNPEPLNDAEREQLYNEKNFFYKFVHPVLYDQGKEDSIIYHYERKEPRQREVSYIISTKDKTYRLKVAAINLNLYATGVGILIFYLANDLENQQEPEDILKINQYGRRIFPPFYADIEGRSETANYIQIDGLNGKPSLYKEDFSSYAIHYKTWEPACFIKNLIHDWSENITIIPAIDDRMFVNCWYANKTLANFLKNDNESLEHFFMDKNETNDFWYKYIYVDANYASCQNDEMKKRLLSNQTNKRWQKEGTLYGMSRYSFVCLTNEDWFPENILAVYMRTMYSRMIELILLQRASRLRFSDEVTRQMIAFPKSKELKQPLLDQVGSLHKEYIRFLNQIHFSEVTAQDQGIELYNLLYETLSIENHIKELDQEIAELDQYINLVDDKIRNKNAEILNYIAAFFLPISIICGLLSAARENEYLSLVQIATIGFSCSFILVGILRIIKNK
ncbi:hypothetical protein [Anaerorudis cellulosivorans]|uniref:hypothetical protein n=1 Tax=Anaerorudis cellulosivorans TaxID=3397862 RepID=UPI002220FC77|nr:hypothetical protein [Seramator thermalis]MCW1735727.1 hypothetical protein [Seramator thermalis]